MKVRKTRNKIVFKVLYAVHLFRSRRIEDPPALHKDNLLPAVASYRRCGQSVHVFCTKALYEVFRPECRHVMTLVDDKHTVCMPPRFYRIGILFRKRLNNCDVDNPRRGIFSCGDSSRFVIQKSLDGLFSLFQKRMRLHEDHRIRFSFRNERCGGYRFSETGSGR